MKFSKVLNILLALAVIGYIGYKVYQMPKFDDGEIINVNLPVTLNKNALSFVNVAFK